MKPAMMERGTTHISDMGSRWWGVEHSCSHAERVYPTLHWLGEGPNDPVAALHDRRVLVCDACGDRVYAPDPWITESLMTFERLQRMAAGYFG